MPNHLLATVLGTAALATASAAAHDYNVDDFDAIRASAGVDVTVTVGSEHSVKLVSNTDVEDTRVSVDNGTLTLSRPRSRGININFGRDARIIYEVTMPAITAAEASSGSDVTISGIDAASLELKASSGADLSASGSCETLEVESSSGSDVHAFNLTCGDVTARSSSGSDIRVQATTSIDASASSGSDVWVRGDPSERDVEESSGGDVTIRG